MNRNLYDINFNFDNNQDTLQNINQLLKCQNSQYYYPIIKKLLKDNVSLSELKIHKIQNKFQLDKINKVIEDAYQESDEELDELNNDYEKENLLFLNCDISKFNINQYEKDNIIKNKKTCVKISPIIDVLLLIKNHYSKNGSLDNYQNLSSNILPNNNAYHLTNKINSYNNAAYVESFFLYLSSKLTENKFCPTFSLFYGNVTSIKNLYYHDITEDYYDIKDEKWFIDNLDKSFELCSEELIYDSDDFECGDEVDSEWETESSDNQEVEKKIKKVKKKLKKRNNTKYNNVKNQQKENSNEGIGGGDGDNGDNNKDLNSFQIDTLSDNEMNLLDDLDSDSQNDISSCNLGLLNNMKLSVSSLDSLDSNIIIPSMRDVNTNYFIKLKNIPVQLNFMEELDQTIDDLLDLGYQMTDKEWLSILFQISFGLAVAQKQFKFCHNDLHSSNIMFKKTNQPYLYFYINKNYYRIPTYGRITKIIDFARATFKFKNMSFFSDVFLEGGDAEGQYDRNKNLNGNFSFDLIRLATTIQERLGNNPRINNLIRKWMVTDDGDTIENDDDDFYLYIKIANECHKAVPIHVLKDKLFNSFIVYPTTEKLKRFVYYYK